MNDDDLRLIHEDLAGLADRVTEIEDILLVTAMREGEPEDRAYARELLGAVLEKTHSQVGG
ncbi:MAG TPA: hypothetical protein VIX60_03195 [Candidatus Cybelea sp.]